MKLYLLGSAVLAGALFLGCEGVCCQQDLLVDSIDVKGNQTPVARITGLATEFKCEDGISASGASSFDTDGSVVKYTWTLDGQFIGEEIALITNILCDEKDHQVCLEVEDDKGLKSVVPACQSIKMNENIVVLSDSNGTKIPTPIIGQEAADANQYIFTCVDSYDNDTVDTDNIVNPLGTDQSIVACEWSVTKYYNDGTDPETHGEVGSVKWINVDPAIYKSIDLTLTVTDDDGEKNSVTQSYLVPDELPL